MIPRQMNLKAKIQKIYKSDNKRSAEAKKNILQMLFLKGGNIVIGLLLIPMTLGYVDSDTYGLWLALSSMIAWFAFFDIGIGNGLRNRLTEALAIGDYGLCKKYISTTYAILTMIVTPLMIVLLGIAPFVDWQSLLNIPAEASEGLLASVCVIIVYFAVNFVLQTINTVMFADQKPANAALCMFIQQLVSLILIYVLTVTTKGCLLYLCLAFCLSPLAVCAIFNIILFRGRYKHIAPSLADIDFSKAGDLMKLGIQFFIIQVAGVVQYQMINFIIIRYYGATEVTSYNICYKYFSVLPMVWGILTTPIWSAVTDAFAKQEFSWIVNMQKRYIQVFFLFFLGAVIMFFAAPMVYDLWVGDKVSIASQVSLWVMIYCLTQMFGQIFVCVLNGAGHLKVQMWSCIVSPFVFIGVCAMGISLEWGIISVLIAAIASNFNGILFAPIQSYLLLKSKTQ